MPSDDALIQGLYKCGGYERGHAYLKEHAQEITPGFVSALRDASVGLLSEEPPNPGLAAVFAELAIVAAILLGDDDEKGMACYCKGSILSRLDNHEEAIELLDEAQAYLRIGNNPRQLANCLYDTAISHGKIGNFSRAIRLLEEVLIYQDAPKDRADTLAFLVELARRRGDNVEEFLDRLLRPSSTRRIRLRQVADRETATRICEGLLNRRPARKGRRLFGASIPTFLESSDYHFFLAEDTAEAPGEWPPYAYGLLKRYRDTFNDRDLLGLEAARFADSDTVLHMEIIESLKTMARDLNTDALCISEKGLGHASTFRALLSRLGIQEMPSIPMEGAQPGLYSAFTEEPDTRLFPARCVPLRVKAEQWDFSGKLAPGSVPLYRGEGRRTYQSTRASWDCANLAELASYFFGHGFHGRAGGSFAGTMQAQILHQGYINQPTVSLSASADVCAYYATDRYRRQEGGVVFRVDTTALRQRGPVYHAFGTLEQTCPWVMGEFYDVVVKVMRALDTGRNDVQASGAFLERCHVESRRRAESSDRAPTSGPGIEWNRMLSRGDLKRLESLGISTAELNGVIGEFEAFWKIALGQMTVMETIHAGTGASESTELSRAYFAAFDEVRMKLKEALRLNQFSKHNHQGWDLSLFGYITKTVRDNEFFSAGDVPGECILEAIMVDMKGRQKDVIVNPMARAARPDP